MLHASPWNLPAPAMRVRPSARTIAPVALELAPSLAHDFDSAKKPNLQAAFWPVTSRTRIETIVKCLIRQQMAPLRQGKSAPT